jgi:hypothetical protein
MTRQAIPEIQTFARPTPAPAEEPQLDEGLWRAWIEKNERRDKMKFERRVKVMAIVAVISGVVALVRFVG